MDGAQQLGGASRIRNIGEMGVKADEYPTSVRPSVRRRIELPFFLQSPAVYEPKKMEEPCVGNHRWRGLGGFLERCFLCRKRLNSSDDIFMYRDLRAFCSLECRQVEIDKEEKASKAMLMARSAAKATSSVNHHVRIDNSNMKEWSNHIAKGSGRAAA